MEVHIKEDAFQSLNETNPLTMEEYVAEVKERIDNDIFDGMFTSHQVIEDCSFVDFLFIGMHEGREVVWNACITTARGDYFNEIENSVLDEAYKMYPDPEDFDFMDCFVPCNDGTGNSYYVDPHPELNEKRYVYQSKRLIEEFDKKELKLDPWNINIDETYEYGIGLHVRMNIESINIDDVKMFINEFRKHGILAFDGAEFHKTQLCMDSKEMGIEYTEGEKFVKWFNTQMSVAVNLTEEDLGINKE